MIPFKKVFHIISLSLLSLLLISCGEEGSGNLVVKGAGADVSSRTLLSSFSDDFTNAVDEIRPLVASGNPGSLRLKVYEVLVSPNADCSDAVRVGGDEGVHLDADYQNILGTTKPVLGSGNINGTFNCVIMVASDYIKYTSESDVGASCRPGTEYTGEVCRNGGGNRNFPDASFFSTGNGALEAACADGEQPIPIHLSTISTSTDNAPNAFVPPTSNATGNGINLAGSLVVDGGNISYFKVDGTGKIEDNSGCDMQPPVFSFVTPSN
ncbi:MAG: hypothetical protein KA116_09395 [Proteobacteria bacterium]|nr:hypothetical protein [Pseudomonadota bacterium]